MRNNLITLKWHRNASDEYQISVLPPACFGNMAQAPYFIFAECMLHTMHLYEA